MALGADYITSAEFKTYMGLDNTSQFDDIITDVITSTSREIEGHCRRQFNDAGSATARVYYPTNTGLVIVDDFWTTAGLIVKTDDDDDGVFETTWTTADYQLEPVNGTHNGVAGWPYWRIAAIGNSFSFHRFKRASVQVTARWGWQAVPEPVLQAAKILAADTFQLKDSRLGVAGSDQFGQIVRVRDNQTAASKLRHYVRQRVFVA